jgi:hypothetical protein
VSPFEGLSEPGLHESANGYNVIGVTCFAPLSPSEPIPDRWKRAARRRGPAQGWDGSVIRGLQASGDARLFFSGGLRGRDRGGGGVPKAVTVAGIRGRDRKRGLRVASAEGRGGEAEKRCGGGAGQSQLTQVLLSEPPGSPLRQLVSLRRGQIHAHASVLVA